MTFSLIINGQSGQWGTAYDAESLRDGANTMSRTPPRPVTALSVAAPLRSLCTIR